MAFYLLVHLCLPPLLDCERAPCGHGLVFIYVSSGSSPVFHLEQVGRYSINICSKKYVWRDGWGPLKGAGCGCEFLGLCPSSQEVPGWGADSYTPWLRYGSDHSSGALGETNCLASSSMDVTEHLLCARHHVRVGGHKHGSPQETY